MKSKIGKVKPIIKIVIMGFKDIEADVFMDMIKRESFNFFKVEIKNIENANQIELSNTNILVVFYSDKIISQLKEHIAMLNSNIQQITILDENKKIDNIEEYSKFNNIIIEQREIEDRSFAFSIIYDFYKKYMK